MIRISWIIKGGGGGGPTFIYTYGHQINSEQSYVGELDVDQNIALNFFSIERAEWQQNDFFRVVFIRSSFGSRSFSLTKLFKS